MFCESPTNYISFFWFWFLCVLCSLFAPIQTTKMNFGLHREEDPGYHFAVSGQAFNVITEHFPHLVPKVRREHLPLRLAEDNDWV